MSIDWNDFNNRASNRILDNDLIEDFLDALGCNLSPKRNEVYRGPCPVHDGIDHNMEVRIDGETLPIYWKCYSNHCEETFKPTLLGLVRGVLSMYEGKQANAYVAKKWLENFLLGVPVQTRTRRRPVQEQRPTFVLSREQVRSRLEIPSPYFVGRGYSPAILDQLDIGHSQKLNRSVIPLYDDSGTRCTGFLQRSEEPTCLKCGKCHRPNVQCGYGHCRWAVSEGFPKRAYLYNYGAALRSSCPYVFLVEGVGDALRMMEAGYVAISCLGAELTSQQAAKLDRLNKPIMVVFDNDQAGRKGACFACQRVKRYADHLFLPPQYKDIGEMPVGVLTAWIRSNFR